MPARTLAAIVASPGEVDTLVNDAGTDATGTVARTPTARYDDMIRAHPKGRFLWTRGLLPATRRKDWRRVINLGSRLAPKGAATMTHHGTAGAGVMGCTKTLARDTARRGITANGMNPRPIETPRLPSTPPAWGDAR